MRFSSILALGAFLAPAFAAPLVDNNDVNVANGNNILSGNDIEIEPTVDRIITVIGNVKPDPVKRSDAIGAPADVIQIFVGLLADVKVHTAIINQTCEAVPAGQKPSESQIALIKVQLNVIVDLVKTVVVALGAVKSVLKFAELEVAKLVELVVAIVLEIVCTLLYIVKSLDIKDLLAAIIANLCQVLAGLILILEHIVGGVLALVLKVLNLPAILALVSSILGQLLVALTSGKLLSL